MVGLEFKSLRGSVYRLEGHYKTKPDAQEKQKLYNRLEQISTIQPGKNLRGDRVYDLWLKE